MNLESLLPAETLDIWKVREGRIAQASDLLAVEIPLTIRGNGQELGTFMCTPTHLREFVIGFLFTSRFIASATEVLSLNFSTDPPGADAILARPPDLEAAGRKVYSPGCGRGLFFQVGEEGPSPPPRQSDWNMEEAALVDLMRQFQSGSSLFRDTGAVHSAALCQRGQALGPIIDDIGRHNAVDKVIGHALLTGMAMEDCALLSSGRLSSEILHKARAAKLPLIASRGAPTYQTALQAWLLDITVVGFMRGSRYNLYSHEHRILRGNS